MESLSLTWITAVAVVLYLVQRYVRSYWRLKDIPGPVLAKLTDLQRVWWVKTGRAHEFHRDMHAMYGPIVRFGPNMVSVSDPRVIPTIYPSRPGFPKGDFYRTQKPYTRNKGAMPAVFNTQDEDLHKQLRSPIASLYSMTNVVRLEPLVDETLTVLSKQLDERFVGTNDKPFDLGDWLQYFAFDSMGTLTFSRRYGFLEQGRDMHGILQEIWNFMTRVAVMGQIPWFDEIWNKNSFITLFKRPTGFGVLKVVDNFISQRVSSRENDEKADEKDMLSQFLDIQASNPHSIMPWAPRAWTFSNVMAGSDSTANVMRTMMYNLLVDRDTLKSLRAELLEAENSNGLSRSLPSWDGVRSLPYLDACVLEALRLHPPFCLPFERVVPEGGITVCETYLPAGTVVGISPYLANRDKQTFGDDADKWRPSRWLDLSREDRVKLENSILTFGAGRRTCLGKNIAILEIKKLFPMLLLNYEIEIVNPENYQTTNAWFFRQWGLHAVIRKLPAPERDDTIEQKASIPPALNIPPSSSTVDVRIIDSGTLLDLRPDLFWTPDLPGLLKVTAPTYCFLISNSSRHVLFDLAVRQDWENLPPSIVAMIKSQTVIQEPRNISDVLDSDESSLGIRSKDIEAIIWSHAHFDHIVVGPGIRDTHWPGFPTNPDAINLNTDIQGRNVREISFEKTQKGATKIGSFDAVDYFGDGSLYLLDAAGHSVGHIGALARVTTSPDSFVFMGGDSCHHAGVLRPTKYLPCPLDSGDTSLPCKSDSVFTLSPALPTDYTAALRTVENIKELDACEDVFVVLAHDATLKGKVDFYPSKINDWKAKEYGKKTKWLFYKDIENAIEGQK
ncbi:hypothetical protein N7452_007400 [Penicillium brevicompactum]|uniref:Metallo-beta-lactamase domain-containing protein n=1 Tax=Penicillium brevicompactum TaxID=5074 RepID=A0A9W9QGL6_PENBR|nr:hypothetical protein N7452_007400 [Penicillium brevicompactum]